MKKKPHKKNEIKKSKHVKKNTPSENRKDIFFVAGIGASAGGLDALKVFFDNLPSNCGIAFIIVQHLDPFHKSLLSELIAQHTKMKVSEAIDNMEVNPNSVYIIPPNKDLRILHDHLLLMKPKEPRGHRLPVNSFFHSLAMEQKEKAIGIIFSGSGTDGTEGLKEIKAEGGMTIVQDPETAEFDGMPQSAIFAKTADFILSPEKMPQQLMEFVKRGKANEIMFHEMNSDLGKQIKKILLIIRKQTGYDFSHYKANMILRRIMKREALHQLDNLEEYTLLLQKNPAEVENLYKEFLIGVTSFFRDKEIFDILESKTIPYLLQIGIAKKELRVWVCACSTGEEAYTLAILLKEALEKKKQFIKVLIFASDIDEEAISFARIATYSESISADVSPERLSRYFVRKDLAHFQVKKEIREMVIFAHHNVISDPPFSKMDLISCRNLLIYMDSSLQKKIVSIFHYSLNRGGIVLLGTSENIGEFTNSFSVIDSKAKIFKKSPGSQTRQTNTGFEFLHFLTSEDSIDSQPTLIPMKKNNSSALTEKFLIENYPPPSVVIDKNKEVIYFLGNRGLFLKPLIGEADFISGINNSHRKNSGGAAIEKELKITREHLQTAISELETSNKNLQTSNEEFQSYFEELQSTNEELETSREELQSVNEELTTVNSELRNKIEQLSLANDDLNNLLTSIEVATVFLDRDLKIKRFTPTATKIFNLIPSDIDRPVTHLSGNIIYKALKEDVKNVLRTLAVKTDEVQATDGAWYHMRILPYRTAENVIEGVLITFVDISAQKRVEEKLRKTNEHLNLIIENLPAIPYTCITQPEIKITFIGKSSEKVTGFLPEQFQSKASFWIERLHPDDKKKFLDSLSLVVKKGMLEYPFRWKCANGKYKNFINYLRYAKTENGRPAYLVGVWQEVPVK